MKPLGIFGGMFDPVHFGHLRAAFEVHQALGLERVHLIPASDPPHRDHPVADGRLRLAMLRAAIAEAPWFEADGRELERSGRSYTVLTLEEFRRERGEQPLVLIVGLDAFLGLTSWHRWQELLELAHLAVVPRPGGLLPVAGTLADLLDSRRAAAAEAFATSPAGRIYVHQGAQLDVSSSGLRATLEAGRDPRYLMPESVRRMILETGTYARRGNTRE